MSSIERQCWKKTQYLWSEYVEVVGLTSSIKDKDLEPTVCRVFQHVGVGITGEGIEAKRKDYGHVMQKKSELRKLKPSKLDLPNGTKFVSLLHGLVESMQKAVEQASNIFFFHC